MVYFSHEDIPEVREPGSYTFAKDVARQARDVACNFRSQYPKAFEPGTVFGNEWARAMWDDVCRKSPSPTVPPKEVPFNGGQCQCIPYAITHRITLGNGTQLSAGVSNISGRILAFGQVDAPNGIRVFTCRHEVCSGGTVTEQTSTLNEYFIADDPTISILSIARTDGQPDNCGDPPADYPPPFNELPPSNPPPIEYDPPTVDAPGQEWNITIPFVYLKPDFTFNVDVGGVTLNFDLGGISFNIDSIFGDETPGSTGTPPPDLSALEKKVDDAKEAADAAKAAADAAKKLADDTANNDGDHPQNDPNKQEKEDKTEDDPKEEDGIERLLAVKVILEDMPSNRRQQDGGGAPDVIYAGWFEFKTKGVPHPRQPIHFDFNYFIAPIGADGYAYTLYNGFTGRAQVITAKAS